MYGRTSLLSTLLAASFSVAEASAGAPPGTAIDGCRYLFNAARDPADLPRARARCREAGRDLNASRLDRAEGLLYAAHLALWLARSEARPVETEAEVSRSFHAAFCESPALMTATASSAPAQLGKPVRSILADSGAASAFRSAAVTFSGECPDWTLAVDEVAFGGVALAIGFGATSVILGLMSAARHDEAQTLVDEARATGAPVRIDSVLDLENDSRSLASGATGTAIAACFTLALSSGYVVWRALNIPSAAELLFDEE